MYQGRRRVWVLCGVRETKYWLDVLPYFMLLSRVDDFVSLDGGTILGPVNLWGRVRLHRHSQLHVLL